MTSNPIDLLGLSIEVIDVVETATEVTIEARAHGCPHRGQAPCPGCKQHGRRLVKRHDVPLRGKPARINLSLGRYRCVADGRRRVRMDLPPGFAAGWRLTTRLVEDLAVRSLAAPLAVVAEATGVSRSTVRRLFGAVAQKLSAAYEPCGSRIIGLDEAHLQGTKRATIASLDDPRLIDLLPGASSEQVSAALADLERRMKAATPKGGIEVVVIDMHPPYRAAIRAALPGAAIIADKRHVLELARRVLLRLRARYQSQLPRSFTRLWGGGRKRESLNVLLTRRYDPDDGARRRLLAQLAERAPLLIAAYHAKEAFNRIYDCQSRGEAETAFANWVADLSPELRKAYRTVIGTVTEWRAEIFAYFDHLHHRGKKGKRVNPTNGYTEAINVSVRSAPRGQAWRMSR